VAPGAPAQPLPPPGDLGRYGGEASLGSQIQSGYYGGLAGVDRLAANLAHIADAASTGGGGSLETGNVGMTGGNLFHLFDTAVSKIAGMKGLDKGGVFKHLEDWLREQQKYREEQAAQYAGERQDLPSKFIRGGTGAVMSLPIAAAATALGGPVGGMAALGALETADQGPLNMLKGAAEGAAMGKFLHIMGPYGRPIRIPAVAGVEYAKNIAQGVDPETALANALNMGALTAIGGPGTKKVTDVLPETLPESMRFKSTLNPVQQQAVDYAVGQGIPLRAGQLTGNRYLQATEASAAHTPLGAQAAQEFGEGTQQALARKSGELAGEVHPEPVTPYEAGATASDALDRHIAELNSKENDAYKTAWQHAGKPDFDKYVPVKTRVEPVLDEAGEPTGEKRVPVFKYVNMPVDVRWMKMIARDQIPKYEYSLSTSEQSQSKAYNIYKKILKGDDYITAEQAEEALKGLKAEARGAADPNLRNVAQGAAAQMIPRLQKAIDAAVAETGQDSVAGLQAGRQLHAQKMEIADVSKKLREEPVQAFGQLTMARDAGVNYLKELAKRAPDVMPKLGRAYLDNLFDLATREGGWSRARTVFNNWENLGDQTKALLFPEPSQRNALDRFFFAAKMIGEPINPSGTAMVQAAQKAGLNPFKWAEGWVGSKLLFTPRGIKFLTGVAQNPPQSASETAAVKAQAEKIFGPPEKPPEEPPPAGAPAGGGAPPPSPQPGGGAAAETPASRKQGFIDRVREFMSGEEGASPSRRGRPMGLQELMGQPEKVLGGEEAPRELKLKATGKEGALLTSDLGQALENSVSGRYRLGKKSTPEQRKQRALESMTSDLRYALAEDDGGAGWYTDDVATMEKHLTEARPEFKDPAKMSLFKYVLGITSNGVDPEVNFDAALRGWDMYQRDGKFSAYDKTKTSEFGNPKGLGLTFRANGYEGAMNRLSQLITDKGEAGAAEWLQTKHPVSELKKYYKDVPGKAGEERYGSYIFGEKVGAFGSNLNGIHTELTADKWWSRSWNRWMGTLMDTDAAGNVRFDDEGNPLLQDTPRNEGERNLMRETAANVAKDLGLKVSELQAILWYAEQRLYRFYGIDASSVSYADAARKQFGRAAGPPENAGNRGPSEGGRPNADDAKAGRGSPQIPQGLPGPGSQGAGKKVTGPKPGPR
jgi:hypothetical protein